MDDRHAAFADLLQHSVVGDRTSDEGIHRTLGIRGIGVGTIHDRHPEWSEGATL